MIDFPSIEAAIAAEAAAHARAVAALHPYAEAEVEEIGRGRLVYSGAASPVHGAFGLGLDGPLEERDWRQIHGFFLRKDRPASLWVTPFTDRSVLENIRGTHRPTLRLAVRGEPLEDSSSGPDPHLSGPDLDAWGSAFGETLAFVKLHQENTRFFLEHGRASYTYFHQGIALVPRPDAALLAAQRKQSFQSRMIVVMGEADLPLLYERILYEPV